MSKMQTITDRAISP